jgi:hypothetical protein
MLGKPMWVVDDSSNSTGISFINSHCFSSCCANILRNPLPTAAAAVPAPAMSCRVNVQAIIVFSDWEKRELFSVNLKTTNVQ